jgi:hypothetical protein
MKAYGEWMYRSTLSWTRHYFEVSGQLHAPPVIPPRKEPPTPYWVGGWIGPSAGLDDLKKRKFLTLLGLELQPLCCPARSQSLYRLRHPGSPFIYCMVVILAHFSPKVSLVVLIFRDETQKLLSDYRIPFRIMLLVKLVKKFPLSLRNQRFITTLARLASVPYPYPDESTLMWYFCKIHF